MFVEFDVELLLGHRLRRRPNANTASNPRIVLVVSNIELLLVQHKQTQYMNDEFNVGLMLGHRLRCWANINPTLK